MIIISDIHGCFYTLLRLLKKCPDEEVYFLGDLIDRGPHSADVVRFAMEHRIPTVLGNHEDLMLAHYGRPSAGYGDGVWLLNGGATTEESFGGRVPTDVLDWTAALPLFIDLPNEALFLSHTGAGDARDRMAALWHRGNPPRDLRFRVFGHTPHRTARIEENWACIDTGAAYGNRGLGVLSALVWPAATVIFQTYNETPLAAVA